MRIIIKPLGIVVLFTAFICVTVLPRLLPTKGKTAGSAGDTKAVSVYTGNIGSLLKEENWETYQDPGASLTRAALTVTSPALKQAYRFDIGSAGQHPWSIGYHNHIIASFPAQSDIVVKFWARADASREISLIIQSAIPPFTPDSQKTVTLSPEWKEYSVPLTIQPHSEGAIYLSFQLGKSAQSVELGDVQLTTP